MEIPVTELATGVGALVALGWIVKYFLSHLEKKDKVFTETINNHLTHSIQSQEKLTSAVDKLSAKL